MQRFTGFLITALLAIGVLLLRSGHDTAPLVTTVVKEDVVHEVPQLVERAAEESGQQVAQREADDPARLVSRGGSAGDGRYLHSGDGQYVHGVVAAATSNNESWDRNYAAVFELAEKASKQNAPMRILNELTAAQLAALSEPVHPPAVKGFAVVPTDHESYRVTFGEAARMSDTDLAEAAAAKSAMALIIDVDPSRIPTSIEGFRAMLHQDAAVFTFVGHNKDGYLMIPPSAPLSLKEMSESCAQAGKVCVLVSCGSNGYGVQVGVDRSITFQEANQIVVQMNGLSTYGIVHQKTGRELVAAIPILLQHVEVAQTLAVYTSYLPHAAGATGVGLVLVAYEGS